MAKDAVIFASPPWGGPDYSTVPVFDLKAMEPYSLPKLWELFHESTTDVAMYLPRTSNLNQLAALGTDDTHFDVVHYTEWGASKASDLAFTLITKLELTRHRPSASIVALWPLLEMKHKVLNSSRVARA